MAKKHRYTAQQVIAALDKTRGMVYLAAKLLRCDPDTVQNYCKRFPTVEAAKVAARGELLDVAELKLWQAVQQGDAWAIAFTLKTLGKQRGYVERQVLEHEGHVQLTSTPEWQALRTAITQALKDMPDARVKLAAVLAGEQRPLETPRNGTTNGTQH
jgi:hypothetical protein